MMFCKNCGAHLEDGARFCATCGSPTDGSAAGGIRTNDHTAEFDNVDIAETKFLSLFCYFGILGIVLAAILKPHSKFIRFHANQGLLLMVLSFASGIVCIIPVLGWIAGIIGAIFVFVCMIIGIVNSCCGKAKELPIIGRFRIFS